MLIALITYNMFGKFTSEKQSSIREGLLDADTLYQGGEPLDFKPADYKVAHPLYANASALPLEYDKKTKI